MRPYKSIVALIAACLICQATALAAPPAAAPAAPAATPKKKPRFIRVRLDEEKQPLSLDTSVVSYSPNNPRDEEHYVTIDLIGVVHVGDKSYYKWLNKQFTKYDVVLYELVAPKGTRVPKGGRRDTQDILSMFRTLMQQMLELEDQMKQIDYTQANLVHADLSPLELKQAMAKRGDTQETIMLYFFMEMMKQQNAQKGQAAPAGPLGDVNSLEDLLKLLGDPNRAVKMKRQMAKEFDQIEKGGSPSLLQGGPIGKLLIDDRNAAAMKVLLEQVAKGKKKIGIFYGAAHMPDFEKRIMTEHNFKRNSIMWVPAWDLRMDDP